MEIKIRQLGRCPFPPIWHQMRQFTEARTEDALDELWVLEHFPVFTQGQAGKSEHVLNVGDIPVVQTDRGGQITYHGPGQLVLYTLIDLHRLKTGVKAFVSFLEQSMIQLLSKYQISAHTKPGAPGVYIDGKKIGFLGLKVHKGRVYHGLALNINMDLEPFSRIHPCGYEHLQITQLADWVSGVEMNEVKEALLQQFLKDVETISSFLAAAGHFVIPA
ncbi:MAG: lipoyl(octanoyl) transferase LipB [Pseudomonadota bacterium]|nr:lipoyl(octanoyl) transferase LipB [Gammaproteobacteria bacterium]MBU2546613.1 lipoyl(octanoyl) transferase LipB [Gammaproteobacteria bacterium]